MEAEREANNQDRRPDRHYVLCLRQMLRPKRFEDRCARQLLLDNLQNCNVDLTASIRTVSPEAHLFSIERKREPGRRPKVVAVNVEFNFEPVRKVFARRILDYVPAGYQK